MAIILTPINLKAEDACQPVIDECINVLDQADKYVKSLQEENSLQSELLKNRQGQINEQNNELNKFYRNPLTMFLLGALATGILINK
jgi:hypothetical protein